MANFAEIYNYPAMDIATLIEKRSAYLDKLTEINGRPNNYRTMFRRDLVNRHLFAINSALDAIGINIQTSVNG